MVTPQPFLLDPELRQCAGTASQIQPTTIRLNFLQYFTNAGLYAPSGSGKGATKCLVKLIINIQKLLNCVRLHAFDYTNMNNGLAADEETKNPVVIFHKTTFIGS